MDLVRYAVLSHTQTIAIVLNPILLVVTALVEFASLSDKIATSLSIILCFTLLVYLTVHIAWFSVTISTYDTMEILTRSVAVVNLIRTLQPLFRYVYIRMTENEKKQQPPPPPPLSKNMQSVLSEYTYVLYMIVVSGTLFLFLDYVVVFRTEVRNTTNAIYKKADSVSSTMNAHAH